METNNKLIITDEIIRIAIQNAPKDQYGQTPIMEKQVSRLFPNNIKEVEEFLKTSEVYCVSTYGWKYGTYKAIYKR